MNVVDTLAEAPEKELERIGPYVLYSEIGCGGMASVHLGKLLSASGFSRIVAIKRMHSDLARSPDFVTMFFEEARLVSRIQHPNVVAALDCLAADNTVMLIMEYVHGLSLDQVTRSQSKSGQPVPAPIVASVVIQAGLGLHAAHQAVDESGKNLGIVHRDVSPHNILVGEDGVARVLDFGIAKAAERVQHTRTGEVKGKLGYMAPEQLFGSEVGREADVYALGVITWELLTGRRLFAEDGHGQMLLRIANNQIDRPSEVNPNITPEVEAMVMKALARSPEARYRTALEFVVAIENSMPQAGQRAVGEWVAQVGRDELAHRATIRSQMDLSMPSRVHHPRTLTGTRRFEVGATSEGKRARAAFRLGKFPIFAAGVGAAAVVATVLAQWPRATPPAKASLVASASVGAMMAPAPSPASVSAKTAVDVPAVAPPVLGASAPSTAAAASPIAAATAPAKEAAAAANPSGKSPAHLARAQVPSSRDGGVATTPIPQSSAGRQKVLDIGSIGGRE